MKCFKETVLIVLFIVINSDAESKHRRVRHELSLVFEQFNKMKTVYENEFKKIHDELEEIK